MTGMLASRKHVKGDSRMWKFWPWKRGAPVVDDHNELEEEMVPDPERETEIYDLQAPPAEEEPAPPPREPNRD